MSREKKGFKIFGIVLLILTIALGTSIVLHIKKIQAFNDMERVALVTAEDNPDADVNLIIHERGQATDTWSKEFQGVYGYEYQTGLIYDATIKNYSEYDISEWIMRVNVTEDYFINNGWNGNFEIHQVIDGVENSQTLNLQDPKDIDLVHYYVGNDLVIPLQKGDCFIYYPEPKFKEDKVIAYNTKTEECGSVTIGFIIYYGDKAPVFKDAEIIYKFHREPFAGKDADFYITFLFIWVCLVAVFITLVLYNKSVSRKFAQNAMFINSAMSVFTGFFEAKDSYTRGHSKRVAEYSARLAKECGKKGDELQRIYHIAYMHDCGKCYIPDTILKKEGKLTPSEFELMKSHTTRGAEMVKDFIGIKGLYEGVRCHHERYDGTGYPDGLKGEEIPWIARVICIADSYDAMSSNRCYHSKLTPEEIREEFVRCSGKQFDPNLTDVFLKILDEEIKVLNDSIK